MALILSMTAVALLGAFGTVLALGTLTETTIAATFREAELARHAAEAIVEAAMAGLPPPQDWAALPSSTFTDGAPAGVRRVGAVDIDLAEETNDVNALARQRSAWTSPPRFELHAFGRLDALSGRADTEEMYLIVWAAVLPEETVQGNVGQPVLGLIGKAYGGTGSRRTVAVAVAPSIGADGLQDGIRLLWWREV